MTLRAIIFDVDGTLVDTVDFHAASWHRAFKHFGHDVPQAAVRTQIGKGGDQLMPEFLPQDVVQRDGKAIEAWRKDLFMREYMPQVRAFPQVRALFERVRADGLKPVLASSAKGDELEDYKKAANIADLVEKETSSDDAERSKPHPDIFQAALERAGVAPDEALVIGDAPYDAEAATKAGIAPVGVLCGGFPEAELRGAGARAIYRDPADLLANWPPRLG